MKTDAKIINLKSVELAEIIKACTINDRTAQRALYDQYASIFLGICIRYLKDKEDAEDAMISSFQTIFEKINTYKHRGSFEGWMKRIVINRCLMEIRKKSVHFEPLETDLQGPPALGQQDEHLYVQDILVLLDELPEGQRTVFNLYAIEGFKHREIADHLKISINTSKSQLIQARKKLAELILKNNTESRNYG